MKKGYISSKVIFWLARLIYLIPILIIIVLIISLYLARSIDTTELESDILYSRITYGGNCVLYNNGAREVPGTIDLAKLNEDTLNKCFDIKDKKIGLNIRILDDKNNVIRDITINKDVYELNPACKLRKSKFSCHDRKDYRLYFDAEKIQNGIIYFSAVIRNE